MYRGEKFKAMTHVVGVVPALAGTVVLIVLAALSGDPWKEVGVTTCGVTFLSLYSISGLYDSVRGRPKNVLRALDHQSNYLLIAGSYTPSCLVTLRGPWGWSLFGIVRGLAAGRLFYTVGLVFYALDARLAHAQGVWRLFVLAGSASHY